MCYSAGEFVFVNGIVLCFVLFAFAVVCCAMVGTTTEEKWDTKGANAGSNVHTSIFTLTIMQLQLDAAR